MKKIIVSVLIGLLCSFFVGCTNKNELEKIADALSLPQVTNQALDLPNKSGAASIVWETDEPLVIENNGKVYAYDESHTANLTAIITLDGQIRRKQFIVTVKPIEASIQEGAWEYYRKKIVDATVRDLTFITDDYNQCSITYVSSNENVLTSMGKVTQSAVDQTVTMYGYIERERIIKICSKNVVVKGYSDVQRINFVKDWIPSAIHDLEMGITSQLPTTHPLYGTEISWYSLTFGLISSDGMIIKPLLPQNVKLECTIRSGSATDTIKFNLQQFGGNITNEERTKLWLVAQLPTKLLGSKNYLKGDFLDHQERIHTGGVLNLMDGQEITINQDYFIDVNQSEKPFLNQFFGSGSLQTKTHPTVSQAKLDALFYPGYQMPNEQNILWIVIHESGMPTAGQDAEFLAKLQYNTAFTTEDARQASWNYQVDEHAIYQSFADDVICWHASDGTSTPGSGNNNGIGIEMCINQDGNYEGAMHNDAKLVAHLLDKYHLTLDNVKRHYDFAPDKKQCPNYMIQTGRWTEFLDLVNREYMAIQMLKGAEVLWKVTTETNQDTNAVLAQYFEQGQHNLWFNKAVSEEIKIFIEMIVLKDGQSYQSTSTITLCPDKKDEK